MGGKRGGNPAFSPAPDGDATPDARRRVSQKTAGDSSASASTHSTSNIAGTISGPYADKVRKAHTDIMNYFPDLASADPLNMDAGADMAPALALARRSHATRFAHSSSHMHALSLPGSYACSCWHARRQQHTSETSHKRNKLMHAHRRHHCNQSYNYATSRSERMQAQRGRPHTGLDQIPYSMT